MLFDRLPPSGKTQPKTYYFSVGDGLSREIRPNVEPQQVDHVQSRFQGRDSNTTQNRTEDVSLFYLIRIRKTKKNLNKFTYT